MSQGELKGVYKKTLYKNQSLDQMRKAKREVLLAVYLNQNPHQNIARYYKVQQDEHAYYIYMEQGQKIDHGGQNLKSFDKKDKVKFIIDQCKALSFLEKHGIQHRDIRNQNWIFKIQNEVKIFKLIDFGLSKMVEIPRIFQQRLCADVNLRKKIMELNCGINLQDITLGHIGLQFLAPPEYQGVLNLNQVNELMIGRADAWLMAVQTLRLFYKINENHESYTTLRKTSMDLAEEAGQKLSDKTIQLRKIFSTHIPNNQAKSFHQSLLSALEMFAILNVNKRKNARHFLVKFKEIILKADYIPVKDLEKYLGPPDLHEDIQRMACLYEQKAYLQSQHQKDELLTKKIHFIQEVINIETEYLASKYEGKHREILQIQKQIKKIRNRC